MDATLVRMCEATLQVQVACRAAQTSPTLSSNNTTMPAFALDDQVVCEASSCSGIYFWLQPMPPLGTDCLIGVIT